MRLHQNIHLDPRGGLKDILDWLNTETAARLPLYIYISYCHSIVSCIILCVGGVIYRGLSLNLIPVARKAYSYPRWLDELVYGVGEEDVFM